MHNIYIQGDHLSGNVAEFDSCHGNVGKLTESLENVRNSTFGATSVFVYVEQLSEVG